MLIKQLSVFIENKPGRLADVTEFLAKESINIHALSIADTTDFGILRLIVDNPEHAKEVLRDKKLTVKTTDVVGVSLEHQPGSLASILRELEKEDISIEYMYAFTSRSSEHDAIVILRLANQETAFEKLKNCDIKVLGPEVLDSLNK